MLSTIIRASPPPPVWGHVFADPAAQVVAALEKAGKDFDFLPIMGSNHGAAESPYGKYRRADFLVRHLQAAE